MIPGMMEIIVVMALVGVMFGPGKLGEVMGALGKGVKDFKSAADQARSGLDEPSADDESDGSHD
jgi:sec-independent protein translocase protein TatA